jgi:hypothetical protein
MVNLDENFFEYTEEEIKKRKEEMINNKKGRLELTKLSEIVKNENICKEEFIDHDNCLNAKNKIIVNNRNCLLTESILTACIKSNGRLI